MQRPQRDNTQHSQETDIHSAGEIRNRNPSKRAAANPRLRPRGHRDQLVHHLVCKNAKMNIRFRRRTISVFRWKGRITPIQLRQTISGPSFLALLPEDGDEVCIRNAVFHICIFLNSIRWRQMRYTGCNIIKTLQNWSVFFVYRLDGLSLISTEIKLAVTVWQSDEVNKWQLTARVRWSCSIDL